MPRDGSEKFGWPFMASRFSFLETLASPNPATRGMTSGLGLALARIILIFAEIANG
jgi:hypothetical protein